jgi:multidrug efflux pump subunit AcrB
VFKLAITRLRSSSCASCRQETLPPEIINFSASSVPILQLGISGKGLNEQQFADLSTNYVRPQLITVPRAIIPTPYGGKQPQISINMDEARMQSEGVSPGDILTAVNAQNVVMPSGTAKIGVDEYDVRTNAAPRR